MRKTTLCILLILAGTVLDASAQRKAKHAPKKKVTQRAKAKQVKAKPGKTKTIDLKRSTTDKDTSLKGATIEIIQSYRPEIKNTPKPEFSTNLPPADTTAPTLSYDVPQQSLSYTYSSFPLKPLALGTDSMMIPFENYVKAGAGNLSTLFLDAGIGSLNGLDYETNLHLHHLSQAGNIKYQKSSLSDIQANGTLHRNDHAWHASIDALRNRYYHYGYDHAKYTYETDAVQKTYYGGHLGIDMQNESTGWKGLNYHPSFDVSLYGLQNTPSFGAAERTITFNAPVSYSMDTTLSLQMGINAALTQFNDAFSKQSNNILQFTPGVLFRAGIFTGHAGLYPTIGKNAAYLLPDMEASFVLPGTQFTFNVGWQALLHRNSFEELSSRNPYMWDSYTPVQTRSDELFAGIKSNIGNHISFSGRVSWWQYNNMALFVNDTLADEKRFLIVYDDKVNALSLQASIRYEIANALALGFSGAWYNYYKSTSGKVWHEPGIRFKGDLQLRPIKKLTVTAYLSVMDEMYALIKGNTARKLNTVFDLGGNAEYNFIPSLSAFIEVNNILNNKYQRWYGYEAYGFNIFAGLRLKF